MAVHASLVISIVTLALLCGWASLLVNRGIANFNDAVRPILGERNRGTLERAEIVQLTREMSVGIASAGLPFALITAILVGWPVLIVADIIGVTIEPGILAAVAGAGWGGAVGLAVQAVFHALAAMPVDVIAALHSVFPIFLTGFAAIPVVACAYQFGVRICALAGVLAAGAWLIAAHSASHRAVPGGFSAAGSTAAVLTGLAVLIVWTVVTDLRATERGTSGAEDEMMASGGTRLRGNLPWLAVQGAILGFAVRSFAMSWSPLDVVAVSSGHRVLAAALVLLVIFGFWPASVTSALSTGVYQSVGLATVFAVGYLSPNPLAAAVLGAAVITLEVLLLPRLYRVLDVLPTFRGTAESIRAAMEFVVFASVLAGVGFAAIHMTPAAIGFFLVIAAAITNSQVVQKIFPVEGTLYAGILTGVVANVLVWLGYMAAPRLG